MYRDIETEDRESNWWLACRIGIGMAMVKAVLIASGLPSSNRSIWYPISDFAAGLQISGVLDVLGLVLVGLFVAKGQHPRTLLFGALSVCLMWFACYSTMGAFVPQAVYSLLFYAAIAASARGDESVRSQIRISAILFFAIMFILAALQKINPSYLAGSEFLSPQSFFGAIHYFFGAPPEWLATKVLPIPSIVIELVLGFGLLWRPRVFAHLSVFFILALALLHTSVLFVYLAILPLLVIVDPAVLQSVRNSRARTLLANKYFWFFIHVFFAAAIGWKGQTLFTYFARHWIVALFLMGVHIWIFRRCYADEFFSEENPLRHWRPLKLKWISLVLLLVMMTPLAAWLGAPTPIGFTMFSGRAQDFANHRIRIEGSTACRRLERDFIALSFTDARFWREGEACIVAGPTGSGAKHIIRRICSDDVSRESIRSIEYKAKANDSWEPQVCPIGPTT